MAMMAAAIGPAQSLLAWTPPLIVRPGARQFTRMPSLPSSRASERVIATIAPLEAT